MINRYTRPEMQKIWDAENRFRWMQEVEVVVAEVQAEMGLIPEDAAKDIRQKARFDVRRIDEIEQTTKHDVIAFVSNLAENVGPNGRYVHYGLTSSDVLDTALNLQIREAGQCLLNGLKSLQESLLQKIETTQSIICAGRTHGMHAEPTTFGLKLCGFLSELDRNVQRLRNALKQLEVGKLSGAVGTYSFLSQEVESKVCKKLNLTPETVATQVVPRDRHAEVFYALASLMAGIERLAVELRHLQRTELSEVVEGFTPGQKGSSAMPHKKNPISSENLTGLSRLVRSYAGVALENIVLWHERDISHSSVERVVLADGFLLADYAVHRLQGVIAKLHVDGERMRRNMDFSQGQLYSSHVLLALVDAGLSREDAYKIVQHCSHEMGMDGMLQESLLAHPEIQKLNLKDKISSIFTGQKHLRAIEKQIEMVLKNRKGDPHATGNANLRG